MYAAVKQPCRFTSAFPICTAPGGYSVKAAVFSLSASAVLSERLHVCYACVQTAICSRKQELQAEQQELEAVLAAGTAAGLHPLDQPNIPPAIKVNRQQP